MMAGGRRPTAGATRTEFHLWRKEFPMADVRLDFEDLDRDELPDLCMKCAAPATVRTGKTFSWTPPWARFMGGLMAMAFMKRRSVNIPLCEEHKNHWVWRHLVTWLSLAAVVLLFIGGGVLMNANKTFGGFVIVAAVIGLIAWLVTVIVVWATAINTSEITDYTITLRNVHNDWVRAYHQPDRGFGRDVDEAARARFGRPGGRPPGRGPRRGPPDDAYERG
jgi:uncharacterized membrane protein